MYFAALLHDIYHKVERDLCLFGTYNHSQADYNEKGKLGEEKYKIYSLRAKEHQEGSWPFNFLG